MCYRYIALFSDERQGNHSPETGLEDSLLKMGMQCCIASDSIRIFVSAETPTLLVPGGSIIIGHIFSRDFKPINDGSRFLEFSSTSQLRKHLTEDCWGEYLLVQMEANGALEVNVMRDPSGGVPCIYSFQEASGFIASDIATATDLGLYRKRTDWDFIAHYLSYPHRKTGRTGLVHVSELLPGCSLRFRDFEISTQLEWSPWHFVARDSRYNDPDEAAAGIRKAVASVVRAWAQTDESILLELSGGLDSSIIGTCLRGVPARVVCSTLVAPVPGTDERRYATLIANYLGVDLRVEELRFENARYDFPPPSYSISPGIGPLQYATNEVKDGVGDLLGITSYFSGAGGDTVFCYLKTAAPAADAFKECGVAKGFSAIFELSALHQCTHWKAGRLTLRKLIKASNLPLKPDKSFLSSTNVAEVPPEHPWFPAPAGTLPGDQERVSDLACTQMYREAAPRGWKRRLRMPLLSQPVVETCLRVPSWMWISGGKNRAIARSAFADMLPQAIIDRQSKGSFMNYSGAVYRKNKDLMRDFLLTGHLQDRGLLDTDALRRCFENKITPRDQSLMRILDLCMTENWVRHQP